jgi:hypothetical protein
MVGKKRYASTSLFGEKYASIVLEMTGTKMVVTRFGCPQA